MKHFYAQIKNFINIALFLGIFLQSYVGNSQTTLSAGDIIFTGYDANPSPAAGDVYSFVLLTNISAGTAINFTDRGYFGGGSGWQAAGSTEATVTWTAGTAIPVGTEIMIKGLTASTYDPNTTALTTNGTVTLREGTPANGLSLSTVGDQIIAFQGSTGNPESGIVTFISGLHYFFCSSNGTSQASWDDLACADGPNSSIIPVGLVGGTSSFYTGTLAGNVLGTSGKFNGTGAPFANAAAIRAGVMNQANWTLSNTTPALSMPSGAAFLGAAPTITTNPPNRTICIGSNTTFSISANDATSYQWQINTGSGFTNISNAAPYSGATTTTLTITAATAGMNGYLYRCIATGAGSATSNAGTLTVSNITATTNQTNVSCFGGSNGSAMVTPSGGVSPYTYSWSPSGGTGAIASGLSAGSYTVTITDASLCSTTQNFIITQPTALVATAAAQTNVSCFGGSNGAASINTPTGGAGGYTYNWTPGNPTGDGTRSVTGLSSGTWTCTITDANSCIATQSFTITQPTSIAVTPASQTNVSCFGGSNGAAAINTPTGGAGGYTYNWTPGNPTGDGTTSVTGLTAGTWTCTVTDANGCTRAQNFTVTQSTAIAATAASQTNISCNGGSTGAASINIPTGGAGGYTYNWSPGTPTGDGTRSVTGLSAGTWTCTVTDANSCTTVVNFVITQPTAISTATAAQTNVSCNGGSNGSASVTPSGGALGYTYSWSPSGGTAATATGLSAGTYTVTVTDANSCTATRNFVITQPTALVATPASQTNVSCFGGSNGAASINIPTGGNPGYTYDWTPGTPTGDGTTSVTGLTAGSWTCTVTDANGCTRTQSFIITQSPAISVTPASQTNVSCFGGSNGAATINTPAGGAGGYTYNWTPGNPTGNGTTSVTGLTSGVWTCTVTDANGCTRAQNFTVTQPTAILATAASQTNVSCNGGSNGAASINIPTGGAGGYTYNWSPGTPTGDGTRSVTGLSAGTWTCTVTDANSCTTVVNFVITQPTAISTATAAQTNVSCNGGSNGSASVTPSGGALGYTYSWSPSGGTAATATGLSAGTYTVTVTDANSCTATRNFVITQPTALVATPASQTNVSCFGGSNGSATVAQTGGTPSYTYSWSPSGGTAATATGLSQGTYTVTVTDANSCTTTQSFTITQPTAISVTPASQTNVSCFGGSNGAATINTPAGGAGGYTYNWTPGNPTGNGTTSVTGLTSGVWTCTVTDANGCTRAQNFTVTQPTAILATAASQTNVSCNGGSNGAASINIPTGGAGGYTYNWSPGNPTGDGTRSVTGLNAGTWTCTVTDANSCTTVVNFVITQPTAISTATAAQTNVSCNGGSNGSASVTPSGGALGYTYSWSPSGGTAATATGLSAGTYTVTVTDANSCTATRNFVITQPASVVSGTRVVTNISCNGGSNGTINLTPIGGTGPYTFNWGGGITNEDRTGLAAGTYSVTITDSNGCTGTVSGITVTQPAAAVSGTTVITNIACNGGTTGAINLTPTGGTGPYTFNWGGGITTEDRTGLTTGTYSVTITDSNGCTGTVSGITVTQPTVLVATAAAQTNVSCNGGSNGSATVSVSGGTSGYSYAWSPSGGTAATATGLSAGTYTVTVTDANGCTTTQGFTITQPTAIDFTTTVLSGYDYNTGYSQTIVASGGTGAKTYAITAGSLPSGFSLSTAGQITGISTQIADSNFTVTATDANNCTATFNYVLILNQIPVTLTATPSQTKVYGESDPVLTYTVSPSLLSGDSFTGSLTRVSGENIGTYVINQGSLSAGSKYLITYVGTDFAITAKPITVAATTSQTKVYGTTDPVFAYTVSPSLVGSDSFIGALTRVAGENIGTYAINQGSLSAGSNYNITYVDKDFTITAKPITVTSTPSQTKVYGTTDSAFAYTVSPNLIGSDAFTGSLTRVSGENIGNYTITQGNLSAGSNYNITYVSKDFAITAKSITVTADASQTKVYGTTNPVYSYAFTPSLVSGDSFTGTLTRAIGENIGNYAITQGTLSAGSNYNITYVSKDFTITAKPITVTANASQTKVYGTTNPVYSYTVLPSLVSGDSFTGGLTRNAGENVGTYTITQGTLSAGGNYSIVYNSSNFTITKADQVITWNQTLGFGCNGATSIVLTAASNSGLSVNYASSNANIASVSNNSLLFQNYGSATVSASQPGNMNYNAAPVVVLPVVSSQPNLIRKQFENIIFFDNSSKSFKSYSWYKNGVLVSGQTSQFYKESSPLNGTYYAVATKLDGTLVTSCPLTLSPTREEEYMRIVPNPVRSNTNFQLMTNISASRIQNARVEVFNLTGNLLTTLNTSQNTIDMIAPSAEGIYIVKMTLTNGTYFTKNLLVRK